MYGLAARRPGWARFIVIKSKQKTNGPGPHYPLTIVASPAKNPRRNRPPQIATLKAETVCTVSTDPLGKRFRSGPRGGLTTYGH